MKNLLAENMVRFGTKNLSEQNLKTLVDKDPVEDRYFPYGAWKGEDRPTDAFGNEYDRKSWGDPGQKLKAMQQKIDELLKNVKLEAERRKDDLEKNFEPTKDEIIKNVLYKTYGLEDQIIEMQKFYPELAINGSHEILDSLTTIMEKIIETVNYPESTKSDLEAMLRYGLTSAKLHFLDDL